MKANEAEALGFSYTGMSASEWDRERWEKYKKEAQELKKTYEGVDYRVVDERCQGRYGSTVYKNIYGNELFRIVQYFRQDVEETYLNEGHNTRLQKLKEEYEKQVKEEMENYSKRLHKYEYIMRIKKK